jgi:hypothetical protein
VVEDIADPVVRLSGVLAKIAVSRQGAGASAQTAPQTAAMGTGTWAGSTANSAHSQPRDATTESLATDLDPQNLAPSAATN